MPAIRSFGLVYAGIILFGLGDGLTSPARLELITGATDESWQGKLLCGSQSLQSLANVGGPLLAGELYDRVGQAWPYLSGAGLIVLAVGAVTLALPESGVNATTRR